MANYSNECAEDQHRLCDSDECSCDCHERTTMTTPTIPQHEVNWSRRHFDLMYEGGRWAVPRSGLIFEKREGELRLHTIMPWTEDMGKGFAHGYDVPPTKEKLIEYQQDDFNTIALRFEAAGVKTIDPNNLLGLNHA